MTRRLTPEEREAAEAEFYATESREENEAMNTTETVWIWNQNCTLAGRAVVQSKLEQYEDPAECGDWHEEDLTEANARSHEEAAKASGAGNDLYHLRIARTIREML
jgi:hypothetical protein